jgi:hypothetical protein
VCAGLKRPPDSSLLGYDGKKDTSMPIGLTTADVCGHTQWAVVVFKKLNCYDFLS